MSLPNFILLGPPRCGTTRIFRILETHPEVFVPRIKEPCYFAFKDHPDRFRGPGDDDRVRSASEYRSLFEGSETRPLRGEASPLYLWHPEAAGNIHREIPDAKLIAILRNPIERTYSHYMHHKLAGREDAPTFEEALEREGERRAAGWSPFWFYTEVGDYDVQIPRYLELFDRSQLRFFLFDDLQERIEDVLAELHSFLGMQQPLERPQDSLGKNASGTPKSEALHRYATHSHPLKNLIKPLIPAGLRRRLVDWVKNANLEKDEMSASTRRALSKRFGSTIVETSRLIGRDLDHWLKAKS